LTAFVATVGYVGREGYRAATDAFVAPIILSPDNDLVLANKLKASELQVERAKTAAQIEALDMDVKSASRATERLKELHEATSASLAWTEGLTARQAAAGAAELRILTQQKSALVDLLGRQEQLTKQMQSNLEAGLVSKVDLAREEQATGRWKVALIETERTANQTSAMMAQVGLAKRALGHAGPSMPEQIARDEQLVRIELEMMKLFFSQIKHETQLIDPEIVWKRFIVQFHNLLTEVQRSKVTTEEIEVIKEKAKRSLEWMDNV
jgi:hypothetical protein